jgi:hypothetical protein
MKRVVDKMEVKQMIDKLSREYLMPKVENPCLKCSWVSSETCKSCKIK